LIHDYVWHEVLAREDPVLVRAMSDTAVVDRVDPSLGLALTGRADVSDLLLKAEERGLFVTRLGPEGWFELHTLVRAALLGELARTAPGRIAELHVRAARWFEGADEVALALEHWLLAGEPRRALRLLSAKHGELYDTGREATIRRTIAAIPVDATSGDVEAMIEYAWCHVLVGRRRFVELVGQLWWLVDRMNPDGIPRGRVTILQSDAAIMTGRWSEGARLARQALSDFGDSWWQDPLGRFVWNGVARGLALTESWDDAAEDVREAERALGGDPPRRVAFEGTRALGEALAGRPVDALRVAAGVRGLAAVDGMTILARSATGPGPCWNCRRWPKSRPKPCSIAASWPCWSWLRRGWTTVTPVWQHRGSPRPRP
jgi:LuxR family maltose regulon positive regulatory protein